MGFETTSGAVMTILDKNPMDRREFIKGTAAMICGLIGTILYLMAR